MLLILTAKISSMSVHCVKLTELSPLPWFLNVRCVHNVHYVYLLKMYN